MALLVKAGGGENVTPQVETYETLLETAIANLAGKAFVPPVKEGQYVWEKYGDVPFEIIRQGTTSNPVIFNVTCESVDLSTVDLSWFDGATGTYDYGSGLGTFEIKNGSMYMDGSLRGTLTYNAPAKQLTLSATVGSAQGWVCEEHTVFIDYVVSDDENAYPDGGKQDGYWYERVSEGLSADECITPEMFGCTKMNKSMMLYSGQFTLKDLNISHGLNEIPRVIIIRPTVKFALTATRYLDFAMGVRPIHAPQNTANMWMVYGVGYLNNGAEYYSDGASSYFRALTANMFRFANDSSLSSYYWKPGIEYEVITMA